MAKFNSHGDTPVKFTVPRTDVENTWKLRVRGRRTKPTASLAGVLETPHLTVVDGGADDPCGCPEVLGEMEGSLEPTQQWGLSCRWALKSPGSWPEPQAGAS